MEERGTRGMEEGGGRGWRREGEGLEEVGGGAGGGRGEGGGGGGGRG